MACHSSSVAFYNDYVRYNRYYKDGHDDNGDDGADKNALERHSDIYNSNIVLAMALNNNRHYRIRTNSMSH